MELMNLLTTRRTYRRFKQDAIPQPVIDDIVNALRLSSSGMNRQAARLLIVEKPDDVAKTNSFVKWAGALPPEIGTPKENEIPTLFVAVLLDTTIAANADVDMGIAMANMTLAAWNHGVGSCIMGAINRPALTEFFALPEGLTLHSMIAFGYPDHASSVVEKHPDSPNYYVDEQRDYFVPKHDTETLAKKF
ncbi:MAG: nitroreductase family protein [Faecalibacterium sp.]